MVELLLEILAIALFILGLYLGISQGVNRTYDIVFDAMEQAGACEREYDTDNQRDYSYQSR